MPLKLINCNKEVDWFNFSDRMNGVIESHGDEGNNNGPLFLKVLGGHPRAHCCVEGIMKSFNEVLPRRVCTRSKFLNTQGFADI